MTIDRLRVRKEGSTFLRGSLFARLASGSLEALADYLVSSGDLDARDDEGLALIHYAACHGNLPLIRELWERGADMTLADGGSPAWRPVHYAIFHRQHETEKVLRTFGVESPLPIVNRIAEQQSRGLQNEHAAHVLTLRLRADVNDHTSHLPLSI